MQCGFKGWRSTQDIIFIIRQISDTVICMEIYPFTLLEKAFDRPQSHDKWKVSDRVWITKQLNWVVYKLIRPLHT